jgi:hypothetical protein
MPVIGVAALRNSFVRQQVLGVFKRDSSRYLQNRMKGVDLRLHFQLEGFPLLATLQTL